MRIEFNPDHVKARAFFRRILSRTPAVSDVRMIIVAHLVDSAIPFIPTVAERFKIQAILGKPSSVQATVRNYLSALLPEVQYELDKESFRAAPESFIADAFPVSKREDAIPVVIIDIGGYFAPSPRYPNSLISTQKALLERGYELIGIVEDTENGHKRYASALSISGKELGTNVYSVARSPLKKPENHLVGVGIAFSIDAILRKSNIVLQSRRAGVIGFGPIGRSVAHSLRNRGIPVSVCELDPIKLATAAAQGFRVFHYDYHFEDFARGLNLVVSATGAGADEQSGRRPLDGPHIRFLGRGTFVASVTSSDDEINLKSIRAEGYMPSTLSYNEDIAKWELASSTSYSPPYFYLMLNGNAINFKHEGVVGPAIQLLQGEVIACVNKLLSDNDSSRAGVHELNTKDREQVANAWLDHYMTDSAVLD